MCVCVGGAFRVCSLAAPETVVYACIGEVKAHHSHSTGLRYDRGPPAGPAGRRRAGRRTRPGPGRAPGHRHDTYPATIHTRFHGPHTYTAHTTSKSGTLSIYFLIH